MRVNQNTINPMSNSVMKDSPKAVKESTTHQVVSVFENKRPKKQLTGMLGPCIYSPRYEAIESKKGKGI